MMKLVAIIVIIKKYFFCPYEIDNQFFLMNNTNNLKMI